MLSGCHGDCGCGGDGSERLKTPVDGLTCSKETFMLLLFLHLHVFKTIFCWFFTKLLPHREKFNIIRQSHTANA